MTTLHPAPNPDKFQDPYCFEFNAAVGIEKPEFQQYGCAVRPVHDLTVDIQQAVLNCLSASSEMQNKVK